MKTKYLTICFWVCFANLAYSQFQNYELNNPDNDSKTYIGRDYVRLLPGYTYAAEDGKSMNARIQADFTSSSLEDILYDTFDYCNTVPWGHPYDYYPYLSFALSDNYDVGEIPISSTIDKNGAKCYMVPINVPLGNDGFQPELSFSYNSHDNRMGIIGEGWSVSGLSEIKRTRKNIFFDNQNSMIKLSDQDMFMLDGNRLIEINRTESAINYETITGNISAIAYMLSGVIKYFKVLYPNGNIGMFGFQDNNENRLSYPLTELKNLKDNIITYNYIKDSEEINEDIQNEVYYIDEIKYGKCYDSDNFASVKFIFSERGHKVFSIESNIACKYRQKLIGITCKTHDVKVKSYNLRYYHEKYLAIISCSTATKKLLPLRFYYSNIDNENESTPQTATVTLVSSNFDVTKTNVFRCNFNKNISDVFCVYPKKNFYTESSFVNDKIFSYAYPADESIKIYTNIDISNSSPHVTNAGDGLLGIIPANVDGDIYEEIIKINSEVQNYIEKITLTILKTNQNNNIIDQDEKQFNAPLKIIYGANNYLISSLIPKKFYSGNFRGAGYSEILYIPKYVNPGNYSINIFDLQSSSIVQCGSIIQNENDSIYVLDIDGDGQTELIQVSNNQTNLYKYNGTEFLSVGSWTLKKTDFERREVFFNDLNSDGKIDVVLSPKSVMHYHYDYSGQTIPIGQVMKCPYCGALNERFFDEVECNCTNLFLILRTSSPCINCHNVFDRGCLTCNQGKCCICNSLMSRNGTCPKCNISSLINYAYDSDLKDNVWTYCFSGGNSTQYIVNKSLFNREDNHQYYIQDTNGDDIPELILSTAGQLKIYPFNSSTYSFETSVDYSINIPQNSVIVNFDVNAYKTRTNIFTFNENSLNKTTFKNSFTTSNLVKIMVNSYGVTEKVEYDQLFNDGVNYTQGDEAVFPYCDFSGSIDVVTQTSRLFNNKVLDNNRFSYAGAIIHNLGLGWCGFKSFTNINLMTHRSVIQEFDPYKLGVITKQCSDVEETNYEYQFTVAENKKMTLLPVEKTITDKIKNNTIIVTYPENEYDEYENAKKEIIDYGGGIKTTVINTYENRIGNVNLIGLLTNKQIINERNGHISSESESFTYNAENRLQLYKKYIDSNLLTEIEYTYTPYYGSLTSESVHNMLTGDFMITSYTYWNNDKYSLKTKTDPLGRVTSYTYNFDKRLLTGITDYLDNTVFYEYDEWNRNIKETRTDGTISEVFFDRNRYSDLTQDISLKWITSQTQTSTGQPSITRYFDPFGREIRTAVKGFDGNDVFSDKEYDNFGRLRHSSAPYKTGEAILLTTYDYDKYNRPERIIQPNGRITTYAYAGNSTTINTDDISTTQTTDATGKLISSTDQGGIITYTYRPDGQPDKIITAGVETRFEYNDPYHRQTKLIDPSAGNVSTYYDDTNRQVVQTWNNGKTVISKYNEYGQLISKQTPDFTTTYGYINGRIASVSNSGGAVSYAESYDYDNFGRIWKKNQGMANRTYQEIYSYLDGQIERITYNTNTGTNTLSFPVVYKYNPNGYLYRLEDASGNKLREISTVNSLGQETSVSFGNGLTTQKSYTPEGLPTSIITSNNMQNMGYYFNRLNGTLNSRTDNKRGLSESFSYGSLYRLEGYGTTANRHTVNYHSNGNILSKTDAGSFTYDVSGQPYTLSEIATPASSVLSTLLDITYTVQSRPTSITNGTYTATFNYNDAYDRIFEQLKQGATVQSTKNSLGGGRYEVETTGGVEKQRLYLDGSPYSATIVLEKVGSSLAEPYYLHRDYLGSVTQISDKNGNLAAEYSYDAWGRMRNITNWQVYAPTSQPALMFGRGFTGHEHLNQLGLINMNARLYDPVLGRFLAADPFISAPNFTLDYNRYMYARNNPLMYVDPSGESLKSMWNDFTNWLRRIAPNGFELGWNSNSGVFVRPTMNGAPYPYMNNPTVGYNQGFTMGNSVTGFAQTTRVNNSYSSQPTTHIGQEARNAHFMQKTFETIWESLTSAYDYMFGPSEYELLYGVKDDYNKQFLSTSSNAIGITAAVGGFIPNAKGAGFMRGVSFATGIYSTYSAINNILSNNSNFIDYSDAFIGGVGVSAAIANGLGYSIPYVNTVVFGYGIFRLGYDFYDGNFSPYNFSEKKYPTYIPVYNRNLPYNHYDYPY